MTAAQLHVLRAFCTPACIHGPFFSLYTLCTPPARAAPRRRDINSPRARLWLYMCISHRGRAKLSPMYTYIYLHVCLENMFALTGDKARSRWREIGSYNTPLSRERECHIVARCFLFKRGDDGANATKMREIRERITRARSRACIYNAGT